MSVDRVMRNVLLALLLSLALAASADSRFAYSYQRLSDGNVTMMHGSLNEWLRVKRDLGPGPYLWTRLDGREYVIRDAEFLRALEAEFKPQRELDREMRRLEDEMEVIEERVERLEDQIDHITDRDDDLSPAEETRVRELRSELREAERALRPFEERERELERREDAMDKRIDATIEQMVKKAVRDGVARRFPD